ncbi:MULTISPECIES: phage holin family protein [unclassified Achromobacter]|uniref:phage holin family protein n=1 Tax=unclassified Achromobacter TaxID=2626865 RepID=UPI000B51E361|nr:MULTISPECIES: phage holin family protein [unclassified Achromobacter]OWT75341.1 hypothetical protein CEY04_17200 [Achromobacter sp. HZ28]OWT76001.1 hypothetical protein CEY05_12650 [Achromobacter sp. HZ34]
MAIRKSLLGVASSLVELGRTRFELLTLEARAEQGRLLSLLGMSFAALLFLTLAVLVFSILVAVYFWPTDSRYMALGVLAGGYAVLGLILLAVVWRHLLHGPAPFAATLEELGRDVQLLDRVRAAAAAEEAAEEAAAQARRARRDRI